MLDQWIASMPKTLLALIAITIGFVVIVASDPPRTVCDSQLDLFKQAQKDFLYGPDGASGTTQPALAKSMYSRCQQSNGPGGCFEFFLRLKKMNADLDLVPNQCADTVATDDVLQGWVLKSLKLMTQISWGDRGPASVLHRAGWFDQSDLSMFCDLKKHAVKIYGVEKLDEWREGILGSLPEAEKMSHESVYGKSLLSTSCDGLRASDSRGF